MLPGSIDHISTERYTRLFEEMKEVMEEEMKEVREEMKELREEMEELCPSCCLY